MKFLNLFTIFSILVLCSSCITNMLLKHTGVLESNVKSNVIINEDKKIIFYKLHHVGKQVFYDDIKTKVDSLIKIDYVIYYEGLTLDSSQREFNYDTIFRKLRKITNIAINKNGYLDSINGAIAGRKTSLIRKHKLVNQPINLFQAYDKTKVKNIDVTVNEFVNEYEIKFGKIVLEEFDYNTKLGDHYNHSFNRNNRTYLILEFRNRNLVNYILKEKSKKIAVVYGDGHYKGMLKLLEESKLGYIEE